MFPDRECFKMPFLGIIAGSITVTAIACIMITTYLCYMYVRYMPFRTAWVNGLQASFFASLSWASFLIVLMAFFFQSSDKLAFTVLLWAGLLVVVPMVWGVLYLRVALMYRMGLKAVSGPVIHKFIDELEVEAGVGLLEVARRLEPNIGERYMLFSRDREQKQRSGSMAGGSGDLLSYVEFQNSLKALMDVHRQALTANRSFWRLVVRKDVSFGDLTAALAAMDAAEKRADNMFIMASHWARLVLDRYPNSPKLLQAYALYLESVKSNPARASRYRAEADRLGKEANKAPQPSALTDGTEGMGESGTDNRSLGALVDDSNDAVVVSNAGGILQFVNKKALELFGYKQGELERKNVRVLMPPPYSAQHNQYIHRYKKTGKALRMGKPASQTVALNAQGFSFPVSLAIKQLQRGDAKAFMGVFKPASFHDVCGYSLADIRGEAVGSLGTDEGMGKQFKHITEMLRDWQYNAAELDTTRHTFEVSLRHKYGAAVPVSGSASYAGTESVRLIVLRFVRDERVEKLGLISLTPAGQVVYVNASMETMLGYEPGFLASKKLTIKDLVRPPYSQLGVRWMQQAGQSSDSSAMAPTSCRTGRIVLLSGRNNKQVPVRLQVVEAQVGTVSCFTATATEVEVPEADAWGGGDTKDVWNNSKRMLLLVHADGRVLAVRADPATALQGFGQDITELSGKYITEVVQDFAKPAGVQHAARGSASFRVGLIPSVAAAKQLKRGSKGAALAAAAAIPCRMVVLPVGDTDLDVQGLVDEGTVKEEDVADGGQLHVVKLRQDSMLEAVLEIDSHLKIKAAGLVRSTARAEDFLAVKRTQLKRGGDQAVGEKLEMEALHVYEEHLKQLDLSGARRQQQDKMNAGGGSRESEMRGNGGDYQRAKRLRKLNKLLTSPKAQKTCVVYSLVLPSQMSAAGFNLLQMMTIARILVASTDAATLEAMIEDVMFGSNRNKLTMPPTDEQQMLLIGTLGGINVKQLSPSRQYNTSLWDLSQRYLVAGRLLAAAAVTPAARTLSNNTELTFMGNNYNALSNGLLQNLGYQTHVSKLKLQQQTKAVPRPVALQLATKEVQVSLEDDQEGDDEDGEAWMRQQQQQEQKNEQGGSGSGLGFNLSAPKRKLSKPIVTLCLGPGVPRGGVVRLQATRNGLNQLVNLFVLNCADFAGAPPAAVSIMNPYFQFLWNVAREGGSLDDGLLTNTADFVSDGQGRMAIITALQVAALVVGVILIVYFHFYQLTPYLRRVKKETRRVAELLSQLPSEVDVAQLVLDSTDVQQEEDRHRYHLRKQGAPNAGLVGALGRLLGSCLGRGKDWVSPAAHQASGSEAAKLSIVVSQNTSKDNEAVSPQPGAHDVSRKVKAYKEQMHRHHSDGDGDRDDPSLWDSHRTPRKISFA
ncbi:hypothetical protein N2152v2_000171 [Parachlorella kessleri]